MIHLDIEPEPDCSIENTDETIAFFERWLFAPRRARAGRVARHGRRRRARDAPRARQALLRLLPLRRRVRGSGRCAAAVRGGRHRHRPRSAQLGASGRLSRRSASGGRNRGALGRFADATYLHQVVEPRRRLAHFPDLDEALAPAAPAMARRRNGASTFTCRCSRGNTSRSDRRRTTSARSSISRPRPVHPAPRDRDLHLGRAAGRPEGRPAGVDRARVRVGAWRHPAPIMMRKTVVLNVVGLTPTLIGRAGTAPHLARFGGDAAMARIDAAFPAVTCTAQADYLTGRHPAQHGIVGNGWYFRDECEIKFWRQSNKLVQAPKIWDVRARSIRRSRARTCSGGTTCTRRRTTPSRRGRCIRPTAASCPTSTRRRRICADELQSAARDSSRCSISGDRGRRSRRPAGSPKRRSTSSGSFSPTLTLVYLPHLDYNLQRVGPSDPAAAADSAPSTRCAAI